MSTQFETITDNKNNTITAPKNVIKKISATFNGSNNKVKVGNFPDNRWITLFFYGSNGSFSLEDSTKYGPKIWAGIGEGGEIKIGKNFTTNDTVIFQATNQGSISIGNDCMFGKNIEIRAHGSHAIFDINTDELINSPKPIIIGDHVWVAFDAKILKGSKIGSGSVVSNNAVVTKEFPNNCVIAGIPAKILKKDIAWERPEIVYFPEINAEKIGKTLDYWNKTEE